MWWEGKCPNNRITYKITVQKRKWRIIFRLKTLWTKRSWRFCYWELKMLLSLHGLLCSTWKFYHIFCLIFCDFWYQSWLEQASESGIVYVFSMQDIVQWSKKLPHRAMPVWNLYKKFQLPTTNVHWDVGCFNRRFPLYLCAMKDRVEHHSSCHI